MREHWRELFMLFFILAAIYVITSQLITLKQRHDFLKKCSKYGESDKCMQLFESYKNMEIEE